MWRGGLSAPASLYIHAERPLLSENGTSTLLHEIMHIALDFDAARHHDWIVEGLAEYYGLELLRRSGTLSRPRYERAVAKLADWGHSVTGLCDGPSSGAITARAVTVFVELDREMRRKTKGGATLDDLLEAIVSTDEVVDIDTLERLAREIIGENPDALHDSNVPGCRTITAP